MAEREGFEPTLARLRQEREKVERRLLERIEDLDARAAAARQAATAAEALIRDRVATAWEPPAMQPRSAELPEPDQAPWGRATGWRRLLAGPIRWLLHDHVAVLDRRHEALARAIHARDRRLQQALDALRGDVRAALGGMQAESERRLASQGESGEAVRELATRCVEAVDRVADVVLHLREMLNAKEAETVQVATEGLRERTTVLLEELARQQEAILAELVGRRQELDELARRARPEGDTEG